MKAKDFIHKLNPNHPAFPPKDKALEYLHKRQVLLYDNCFKCHGKGCAKCNNTGRGQGYIIKKMPVQYGVGKQKSEHIYWNEFAIPVKKAPKGQVTQESFDEVFKE
jgi:hypothetical protein